MKRVGMLVTASFALSLVPSAVHAQPAKPRFVIILDDSVSMTENLSGGSTYGDGSQTHPGCSGTQSKLYLAKAALIDTLSAFGSAEFALATYARKLLAQANQTCTSDSNCTSIVSGSRCLNYPPGSTGQKYCVGLATNYSTASCGGSSSRGAIAEWWAFTDPCRFADGCIGGQVLVPFPTSGSNVDSIYRWIDGKEDLPPFTSTSNREIRGETYTPLASSIDSVRDWLFRSAQTSVGPGAGLLETGGANRDPKAACRPYSIILLTDGIESTHGDPVASATAAKKQGVKVYVIGFGTSNTSTTSLNNIANAGGTGTAYFPTDRAKLTAALGDIIMGAMITPKCDCNETCDDERAAFPLKGTACTVGKGRCKRQGVWACNGTGDGVVCATAATCPANPLAAGSPTTEVCGAAAGCQAPTPEDCQDDDCDGEVDEGLSCSCANKPEICNGVDDNCNDQIDEDIPTMPCGLGIGECKQGSLVCVDGKNVCQGATEPGPEICDNKDNDCDGVIDGISEECFPAGFNGCGYDSASGKWTCKGICHTGRRVCTAGAWGECVGAATPQTEIACDATDNNCDGQVDENNPDPKNPPQCYPSGTLGCDASGANCVGECKPGQLVCQTVSGGSTLACVGAKTPTAEMCNGKDDDCDSKIDEDFPKLGQECGGSELCDKKGSYVCNSLGTDVTCTATSSVGGTEVCDGVDNDCDGLIDEPPGPGEPDMPGVGLPCGSSVGECKPGITRCVDGKLVCNDLGPQPELCNGLDDNCNGSVDEGLVSPGACNPAGLSAGAAIVGECKVGESICDGKNGWQCKGGMGPVTEVCDCKDNNCNGEVDEGDICGAGYACANCECVPKCHLNDELVCPPDRYCDRDKGVCLLKACVLKPCAAGQICNAAGECVDPCARITCPSGATCMSGVCRDCYSLGCPAGQVCHDRQCVADPCAGVTCEQGQYCNDGRCVATCATVICPAGQACQSGSCVADPCAGSCPTGTYCNTTTQTCEYKRCSGIACAAGMVCIEQLGQCSGNPCDVVRCGDGQACFVSTDGQADCRIPGGTGEVTPPVVAKVGSAGSGIARCQFSVGTASHTPAGLWLALLGLAGALGRLSRRGRR